MKYFYLVLFCLLANSAICQISLEAPDYTILRAQCKTEEGAAAQAEFNFRLVTAGAKLNPRGNPRTLSPANDDLRDVVEWWTPVFKRTRGATYVVQESMKTPDSGNLRTQIFWEAGNFPYALREEWSGYRPYVRDTTLNVVVMFPDLISDAQRYGQDLYSEPNKFSIKLITISKAGEVSSDIELPCTMDPIKRHFDKLVESAKKSFPAPLADSVISETADNMCASHSEDVCSKMKKILTKAQKDKVLGDEQKIFERAGVMGQIYDLVIEVII